MANIESNLIKWANTRFDEGDGLHRDIFKATLFLIEEGHEDSTIFTFLRSAADNVVERRVPDREILSAIRSGRLHKKGMLELHAWPKPVPEWRREVIEKSPITKETLVNWASQQPTDPKYWIKTLYQQSDLLCVAANSYTFSTLQRDSVISVLKDYYLELINPSPMSSIKGLTQEGKESDHTLNNVGRRTNLVIEFDYGKYYEHAAILWFLAEKLPLFLMVWSGSKSIHGWFSVAHVSEAKVREVFTEAVMLGADPKMFSKAQFSRLPCGRNNKNQNTQKVIFFEPAHLRYNP